MKHGQSMLRESGLPFCADMTPKIGMERGSESEGSHRCRLWLTCL